MEDTLLKHRIVDFRGNKNALDLWKKYVTEEVLRDPSLGRTGKGRAKREAKRVDTWLKMCGQKVHHWKDPNYFPECQSEEVRPDDGRQCGEGEEGKNDTLMTEKNKCRNNRPDDLVYPPDQGKKKKKKKEEKALLLREKMNYIEGFLKQLEKLDQDTEQHFKKHQNDKGGETHGQCIVTYQNYECRNADVTYKEEVDFFRFFYSSVCLIKENKALIPRGNYLYELIHPQTSSSFPVPNKLSYYFVKLYINNKWRLVFVHLTLPYDEKNQILSCHSVDEKELWSHILMEALLTCFRIFHLPDYHYYLLEMLTGLKCINKSHDFIPFGNHLRAEKCFFIPCAVLLGRGSVNSCDHAEVVTSPLYLHDEQNADHSEETTNEVHTGKRKEDTRANLCVVPNSSFSSSGTLKSSPPHEDHPPERFFFLICSVEKDYIKIKCENVKPRHCTPYSDYQQSVLKAKKDVFPKGYAYINDRGNIRIKDTELVPVNTQTPPNGNPERGNEENQETDKSLNARDRSREPQTDSCKDANCDTHDITVNEDNTQQVLQLIRKILGDGKNSTKRGKTVSEESDGRLPRMGTSKSGKKNAQKDLDKWLDEGELERLTQTINVNYTCQYLIKTNGNFLAKGETIFFLVNRSHFEVVSTNRYAKNRTAKMEGTQKNHNKAKLKNKDSNRDAVSSASNATQEENFPYLFLICSVCINRGGSNFEMSPLLGDFKTQNGPSGSNHTNSNDALVGRSEEASSDGLHEFCFSFFSCKVGRRKRCKEKRPTFTHADNHQGGLLTFLTSKLGNVPEGVVTNPNSCCGDDNSGLHSEEKHAVLSPRDILNCECFVRKIGEERLTRNEDAKGGDKTDRKSNPTRVLSPNLFLNNSGHDKWRDYHFDEEICKRNIHLRGNMEHFFLVYVKRSRRGDFSVEWLEGNKKNKTKDGGTSKQVKKSDDTQHGNNSLHSASEEKLISCSFMTVEEYLEKKLKMKMAFLRKTLNIGEECPMKVLLKYTVTVPQVRNIPAQFFYLIQKANELRVMPHLDLYICNVTKWKGISDVQNAKGRKKKKKKKSEKSGKNENNTEQEDEDEDDEEDDSHNGMKNIFYKISMENFIQKICIPPYDNDEVEGKDECTYLFLVVSKKVERLIGKDLHFEVAIASPSSEKDTSSEEHTKRKKTNIRVSEVSSFCKSYAFNDKGEHIDLGVKNGCHKENTSERIDPKNDNPTVAENYNESPPVEEKKNNQTKVGIDDTLHLNTYNCQKKIKRFKVIKKITINSKSERTWGSIYVDLRNPHLFKNFVVKIIKVKRKKITHEKCANLNFITSNWGREIILKRRRKKNVFFKHVELTTSDSYLLQVEVNMLSDTAQKGLSQNSSPVCLPQRGNNISEAPSKNYSHNHPNILLNVLLNFSDDVSLEEDTSNEDVENEMKKFFDFGKINLENLTLAGQSKHMDNIFSLKNDLLLRYRGNYDHIFRHLSKACSGDIPGALPLGENSHMCYRKSNKCTKGTYSSVSPLSNNNYDDLLCTNKAGESTDLEPSMSNEHFFQGLSSVLSLSKETLAYVESKLLHPGNDRVGRSDFAQMLQAVGSETRYLNFAAPENGDKLDKFDKYPFAKLLDIPPNTEKEERKRKADDPTSKEFEASFDSFLSLSTDAKKTIDDVKATYNLKNKVDIFKIKMDAELQLRENTFHSLGGKIGSRTRSFVKKNCALTDMTKNGAYDHRGSEKVTGGLTNGGGNVPEEDPIPSCDENQTDHHHNEGKFYLQRKIDPPIENLQDLINAIKKVNTSYIQLSDTKNMKMENTKMMRERKAFIENVKNSVKTKRFKNHPTEELKNIYQKGTELKLHIYNPDLMRYIKTHYLLLDRLNHMKALLNTSKFKKVKMTTNEKETFNVEEAVTDKNLFMQLFHKCSDVIKTDTHLQLSDSYKNLFKDAQQIFNKMVEDTQKEREEAA
ncbi:Uncharacterized protein PCOAH_00043880 [Plasmodium coatneyi]|uniref:Calpain catalytic domain-containing protein n=1 Tax=Plasmodium coatneyi TaxID=208452 RepID=A0A1B1E561_9APIC|nr:Uncharacterized protein PCOAH_00043880 [Plasmodium coatneyi]ANQ10164.1 Uncharacterized protein PCOAH_00043880 [Plasmodium coatneyi]